MKSALEVFFRKKERKQAWAGRCILRGAEDFIHCLDMFGLSFGQLKNITTMCIFCVRLKFFIHFHYSNNSQSSEQKEINNEIIVDFVNIFPKTICILQKVM